MNQQNQNQNLEQKKHNIIKLGKFEISSPSWFLTAFICCLIFCGFCIFAFTSCTKEIVNTYIKQSHKVIPADMQKVK